MMFIYPVTEGFCFYLPTQEWKGRYTAFGVTCSSTELHAREYEPAGVLVPGLQKYDVVGRKLRVTLNGYRVIEISFDSADHADVVGRIRDACPAFLTVDPSVFSQPFFIHTVEVGYGAKIQLGGDALPALFHSSTPNEAQVRGKDAYRLLDENVSSYIFQDPYQTRESTYQGYYVNLSTDAIGPLSPVVGGEKHTIIRAEMIVGEVRVLDLQGRPIVGRGVVIQHSSRGSLLVHTDDSGWARTLVQRGTEYRVGIAGTGLVRRISSPTVGDSFDFTDPKVGVGPDAFQVQVPSIVVGEKRSL